MTSHMSSGLGQLLGPPLFRTGFYNFTCLGLWPLSHIGWPLTQVHIHWMT